MSGNVYHTILICETWLTDRTVDSMILNQSDYYLFREDCKNRIGGGLCALVTNNLKTVRLDLGPDYSSLEILAFDILNFDVEFRFILAYRSPGSTHAQAVELESDLNYLQNLLAVDASIVLVGDFNLPEIDWSRESIHNLNRASTHINCSDVFLNFV